MPALANKTYFNYGGQGPLPRPSLAAINEAWATISELGPFTTDVWPFVERTTAELRQRLATWFTVGPHRIALTENVTAGCVLPLWGLPWQEGDELLLSDAEHPGVVAACLELARRQRLVVRRFAVAQWRGTPEASDAGVLEALDAALTPRTRLVVLSHLLWNTGQTMPIEAVAIRGCWWMGPSRSAACPWGRRRPRRTSMRSLATNGAAVRKASAPWPSPKGSWPKAVPP
jgi:L-cysteine/cystine lyase